MFYFTDYLFSSRFAEKVSVAIFFVKIIFVGIGFVGTVLVTSVISSHITTESPIMLSKFLSSSQVDVLGFQISCLHNVFSDFCTHINICRYSTFDLSCIFYQKSYIYIFVLYVPLMFLIH